MFIEAKLARMVLNRLQLLMDATERGDAKRSKKLIHQLATLVRSAEAVLEMLEPLCSECPLRKSSDRKTA